MLSKFYIVAGIALCIWLGVALASGWKAPNLGMSGGGTSGGGRTFFHSSGFHFGK